MADVAFRRCGNVVGVLPGGEHAVVTAGAAAEGLRVLEKGDQCERVGAVAVLAQVCRWQVIDRFACRRYAVMTVEAASNDASVIETRGYYRGLKGDGQVAIVALVASGRVIDRLAGCDLVVVATDALADRFNMIHARQRHKATRRMAGVALLSRLYMSRRFRGCNHCAAVGVAVDALPKRAFEQAEAVAGATAGNHVGTLEAKTG